MFLADAGADGLRQPVGVHTGQYLAELVRVSLVERDLRERVVRRIKSCQTLHFQLFSCIAEVVAAQVGGFDVEVAGVGDAHRAGFGPLGLDDHHAVGALRAVDGLGRRVLQRRDAFHLVHVQVHDAGQRRLEAVEDEERLVGVGRILALHVGDGRRAAHLEVGHRIRVRTGRQVLYLHEGGVNRGQALEYVLVAHAHQFVSLHRRDSSGKRVCLACESTRDDHLFEAFGRGRKADFIRRPFVEGDGPVLIADVTHLDGLGR